MPLYLTDDEEWALLKFLTLAQAEPERTVQSIREQILEIDRRRLTRLLTTLERKLGKAAYLKP